MKSHMPPVLLPIPLSSPRDLFEKRKRDAALLIDDEITTDRFFNFVVTGYSLIDWIKADPAFATQQGIYGFIPNRKKSRRLDSLRR